MPWQSVRLLPGLDSEQTPSLLEGRYTSASLIRWREGLLEKLGGWQPYYPSMFDGTIRELCAWQSLSNVKYLGLAEVTSGVYAITGGTVLPLTPQAYTSNISIDFSTVINTPTVTIVDANISNITTFDTIYIQTPIIIGGLILAGPYPIASISGPTTYTIIAASNATSTVNNAGATPQLTTLNGSAYVKVTLTGHGLVAGNIVDFPVSTTLGGVTISGVYQVASVIDANNFNIIASVTASSGVGPTSMSAYIIYNIGIGPIAGPGGYGTGGYGTGGYGAGTTISQQTGTPVSANDWTLGNWGEDLLACPKNGTIYYWGPESGNQTAIPIPNAPPFNTGMMVAMPQLILVAWGSTSALSLGYAQDPLLVKWSTAGDFTNWTISNATLAGDFRLSRGSAIIGGFQSTFRTLLWTDVECWAMDYIGYPFVFQFNSVGKNCGLVGRGAIAEIGGAVFWMGQSNFFVFSGGGVSPLPCPVYDTVFQDLDQTNAWKIKGAVTASFNEVWFFYPSISGGTGENDKYVKYNIVEKSWDAGSLPRSAWLAESILGMPIGAGATDNILYQHETGYNANSAPLTPSAQTGWISLAEGEQIPFIDFFVPDMRWGTIQGAPNATLQISFQGANYPTDTPTAYGPYTINNSTEFVPLRIRNRLISMSIASSDSSTFWRMGRPRFRIAPSGRN